MKLLFSIADVPVWAWIASAAIIAVAIILIVLIILWANKKSKENNGEAAESKKKTAVKEQNTEEEKPTKPAKAEKNEPVKAEKSAEKPVQKTEEKKAPAQKTEEPKPAPAKDGSKVYHISKRKTDGKWQIKLEGGAKAIKLFDTQAEAIAYGKTLAENQDARFVLHKLDGSFRKLTY